MIILMQLKMLNYVRSCLRNLVYIKVKIMIKVAERLNHIEEYYFSKKLREVKKLKMDGNNYQYGCR